MLGKCKDW